MNKSETISKVWYKEPWAWFILTPLITVVIVSGFTVTIAVKGADDRVVDNYYKEGRLINSRMDKDLLAASLGLSATIEFDDLVGEWLVVLTAKDNNLTQNFPDQLLLNLSHPATQKRDHQVLLRHIAEGRYQGESEQRLNYRWYLRLTPAIEAESTGSDELAWHLRGEIDIADQAAVTLLAKI